MEEASKRNFQALSDGLKQQREENSKQNTRIKILQQAITELQIKVDNLVSKDVINRALSYGTGPTVK